jgi:hypothetical protein
MEIILLILFQIKHWYADFHIQTYAQTVRKGVWLDLTGISHTLDHVYASLIVLLTFSYFYSVSVNIIFLLVFVEGLIHYLVDYVKVRYGTKDSATPKYWSQFGLDQLVHQLTYLGMVYFLLKIS